jgi:hypothetical protein
MAGFPIVIFRKDVQKDCVDRFCFAECAEATGASIVFYSNTFIPTKLGWAYFVRSGLSQKGKPGQFRELVIQSNYNPGSQAPYTYAVPLGGTCALNVCEPEGEESKTSEEKPNDLPPEIGVE